MRSGSPGTAVASGATSAAVTRSTPSVPVTTCPARTGMPRLAHAAAPLRRRLRPRVDDRAHLDAGVGEVDRRGVGAVVGR